MAQLAEAVVFLYVCKYNSCMRVALLLIPAILCTLSSCTTDPDLDNAPVISYSSDVRLILSAQCNFSGCHGGRGGEFSLDNYDDVMRHVQAGDARASMLYKVITRRGFGVERMPPSGYAAVSNEDVKRIYLWIEQGAPNN